MSRTASGAAFCRFVEQSQPEGSRMFADPVVGVLLDPVLVALASSEPAQQLVLSGMPPGTYGGQVMRTRYIDDVITAWVGDGIDQVVILGAGLDTRAYRLGSLATATVFEVDLPELQRFKQARLTDRPATARQVRYVPLDFTAGSLDEALPSAGFDGVRPALFVWEGVTQYLSEVAVRSTLASVGRSAPGSGLVFTYVLPSRTGRNAYRGWSDALRQQLGSAEPWLFGVDPVELPGLLGAFGLSLVQDVGAADYQTRYLEPIGRRLEVEGERVTVAVV